MSDTEELLWDYKNMVQDLTKPGHVIRKHLTPLDIDIIHATMGISGEAGELLDAAKKHTIYKKEIDRENIIEELGDLEFYMERLRHILGISREQTLEANMAKLAKRYPDFKYTDKRAHDRADKHEATDVQ